MILGVRRWGNGTHGAHQPYRVLPKFFPARTDNQLAVFASKVSRARVI
jgi:hypothetical protein